MYTYFVLLISVLSAQAIQADSRVTTVGVFIWKLDIFTQHGAYNRKNTEYSEILARRSRRLFETIFSFILSALREEPIRYRWLNIFVFCWKSISVLVTEQIQRIVSEKAKYGIVMGIYCHLLTLLLLNLYFTIEIYF